MRFGLVGAGAIAQTWAQAFRASERTTLAAIADVRLDIAGALAEPAGVRAFSSVEAMAESGLCDAAVVCTPPSTHVDVTLALVRHGMHVLCEKPLAVDCGGALKMVAAALDAGVLLTMASKFRFVEDVIRARSIVASGMLGEIVLFSNTFVSRADMRHRWNADRAQSGGGVIIDNGTHSVDIARYLLGPLVEVLATESIRVNDIDVEETARILFRTSRGALGDVQLSWAVGNAANTYLELVGTEGVLRVGWSRSRFRQAASPHWVEFGQGYDKVVAHARQLDVFAAASKGEGELLVTPDDALASVAAIEAAYASMASGSWLPIPPTCA